jgi:hypothetical protein
MWRFTFIVLAPSDAFGCNSVISLMMEFDPSGDRVEE